MKYLYSFLLCLSIATLSIAQTPKPSAPKTKPKPKEILPAVQVYFKINKADILQEEEAKLDKLIADLKSKKDYVVTLTGHTDSIGSSDFNMELSERRVDAVYDFLVLKGVDTAFLKKSYFGESKPRENNEDEEKRQKNRRVEVSITYKEIVKTEPKKDPTNPCNSDTTIDVSGGYKIRANACKVRNFLKDNKADCINIETITTVEEILQSDYPKTTSKKQNYYTAGIMKVTTCTDSCLKFDYTIIYPIESSCLKSGKMTVMVDAGKGGWEPLKGAKLVTVKSKTNPSYEITVSCPNTFNICAIASGKKSKAKVKGKGIRITEMYIVDECPTIIIPVQMKTVVNGSFEYLNLKNPKVYAKGENAKGEKFEMNGIPLSNVKHGFQLSKPKNGALYKKYKFKKSLFS